MLSILDCMRRSGRQPPQHTPIVFVTHGQPAKVGSARRSRATTYVNRERMALRPGSPMESTGNSRQCDLGSAC